MKTFRECWSKLYASCPQDPGISWERFCWFELFIRILSFRTSALTFCYVCANNFLVEFVKTGFLMGCSRTLLKEKISNENCTTASNVNNQGGFLVKLLFARKNKLQSSTLGFQAIENSAHGIARTFSVGLFKTELFVSRRYFKRKPFFKLHDLDLLFFFFAEDLRHGFQKLTRTCFGRNFFGWKKTPQ